jgi:hypothetical protein
MILAVISIFLIHFILRLKETGYLPYALRLHFSLGILSYLVLSPKLHLIINMSNRETPNPVKTLKDKGDVDGTKLSDEALADLLRQRTGEERWRTQETRKVKVLDSKKVLQIKVRNEDGEGTRWVGITEAQAKRIDIDSLHPDNRRRKHDDLTKEHKSRTSRGGRSRDQSQHSRLSDARNIPMRAPLERAPSVPLQPDRAPSVLLQPEERLSSVHSSVHSQSGRPRRPQNSGSEPPGSVLPSVASQSLPPKSVRTQSVRSIVPPQIAPPPSVPHSRSEHSAVNAPGSVVSEEVYPAGNGDGNGYIVGDEQSTHSSTQSSKQSSTHSSHRISKRRESIHNDDNSILGLEDAQLKHKSHRRSRDLTRRESAQADIDSQLKSSHTTSRAPTIKKSSTQRSKSPGLASDYASTVTTEAKKSSKRSVTSHQTRAASGTTGSRTPKTREENPAAANEARKPGETVKDLVISGVEKIQKEWKRSSEHTRSGSTGSRNAKSQHSKQSTKSNLTEADLRRHTKKMEEEWDKSHGGQSQ